MLIETWVAVMIIVCVFIGAIVSNFGWIIEGIKYEQEVKENKKLIKENERLHKIINQMNGLQTVKAADDFYNKEN